MLAGTGGSLCFFPFSKTARNQVRKKEVELFCAYVGDIQPDNCGIRLFAVPFCWNSPFSQDGEIKVARQAHFPRGIPWNFRRQPAAEYHFHDLTGGEANFVGIFSAGNREWGNMLFFLFRIFPFALLQTRASVHPVLTCAWARVIRGVSNPSLAANWKKNWIPPGRWDLSFSPSLSIVIPLKNTGGGGRRYVALHRIAFRAHANARWMHLAYTRNFFLVRVKPTPHRQYITRIFTRQVFDSSWQTFWETWCVLMW